MPRSSRFRLHAVVLLLAASSGFGYAGRWHSEWCVPQTEPKDIREIFLTVPAPQNADDLFSDVLGPEAQRLQALGSPDFEKGKSVLDTRNGYLKMDVAKTGTGSSADRHGILVLTSFTKRNHDRLVVLQLTNLTDYPDPVSTDYFYVLSAGNYGAASGSSYLPDISFFGDFWGEQPQPAKPAKDFVKVRGDSSFYSVEWPRNGTIAKARFIIPYSDTDSTEMGRIRKTLGQCQYRTIELIWDKDKGAFEKGSKSR